MEWGSIWYYFLYYSPPSPIPNPCCTIFRSSIDPPTAINNLGQLGLRQRLTALHSLYYYDFQYLVSILLRFSSSSPLSSLVLHGCFTISPLLPKKKSLTLPTKLHDTYDSQSTSTYHLKTTKKWLTLLHDTYLHFTYKIPKILRSKIPQKVVLASCEIYNHYTQLQSLAMKTLVYNNTLTQLRIVSVLSMAAAMHGVTDGINEKLVSWG